MRWARHAACQGDSRNAYKFWWAKLKERKHLEDPDIDRILLTRLLNRMTGSGMD
jgi:ribonuclease I